MFERLTALGEARAERRAAAAVREMIERADGAAPPGVRVEAVEGGLRLQGRRLKARLLFDPALRWIWMRLL